MSLRDIEIAQSELANAFDSVELQQMVGWLAMQYQRLAAKGRGCEGWAVQCSCWCAERIKSDVVQPELDVQFATHVR